MPTISYHELILTKDQIPLTALTQYPKLDPNSNLSKLKITMFLLEHTRKLIKYYRSALKVTSLRLIKLYQSEILTVFPAWVGYH